MIRRLSTSAVVASVSAAEAAAQTSRTIPAHVKVFDRHAKLLQRQRAASSPDFDLYRYVRDEIGSRVADKVYDLTQCKEVCLDLGCGAGHIAEHLIKENVSTLIQCDMSEAMVRRSRGAPEEEMTTHRVVADEELVPFRKSSIDMVVSSLAAHWINDLPGWFQRCFHVLRPDGCLIGALLSGDTLHELRVSLQLAEMERLGGMGAHVSPFVEAIDIGSMMSRAGFGSITLDVDEMRVGYPSMFALMYDLRGMAEQNASTKRTGNLRRETLVAADAIYRAMFAGDIGDCYSATFQIISFVGWRPGPNMPQAAKRGSQTKSFREISQSADGTSEDK